MGMVNALLVRWDDGYFELLHDASIAANGRREGYLKLGAVPSEAEARAKAQAELDRLAWGETEMSTGIEPIDDEDTPYAAFRAGDTVLTPDKTGAPVRKQVAAISVVEDANGEVEYDLDLGDVIRTPEERHQVTLDKMAMGTLRGNSMVASPATPAVTGAVSAAALDKMSTVAGTGGVDLIQLNKGGAAPLATSELFMIDWTDYAETWVFRLGDTSIFSVGDDGITVHRTGLYRADWSIACVTPSMREVYLQLHLQTQGQAQYGPTATARVESMFVPIQPQGNAVVRIEAGTVATLWVGTTAAGGDFMNPHITLQYLGEDVSPG